MTIRERERDEKTNLIIKVFSLGGIILATAIFKLFLPFNSIPLLILLWIGGCLLGAIIGSFTAEFALDLLDYLHSRR